jgi:aryl-alcohol dehydrogenase-like predicted oxidoreductase
MEYTSLGNTGLSVSRICLGCLGFRGLRVDFARSTRLEADFGLDDANEWFKHRRVCLR